MTTAAVGLCVGACLRAAPAGAQMALYQDCTYRLLAQGLLQIDRRDRDNTELRDQVIQACTRYIEENPSDKELMSRAHDARGDAFLGNGDPASARADYDRAIGIDPSNGGAYAKRGRLLLDQEDYARALDDLIAAIDLGAADGRAYAARARARMWAGEWKQAIADFTKSIAFDDPVPVLRLRLTERASAYLRTGEHDKAIADATRAIELDPHAPDLLPYFFRAGAYEGKGDRERAIADYRAAHELAPWLFDRRALKENVERLGGKL